MPLKPAHRPTACAGIALVLVLWMLALMSVIAGSLVFSTRTEILVAGNLASLARAEALADGAVFRAAYEMTRPATDLQRWKADGLTRRWEYQEAILLVTIIDESGKVDINAAPPTLLTGLLRVVGLPDNEAGALADAIVDWRDGDDLRSLHGAEKDDYAAAGLGYGPANAPFESIDELRQVLGMNDQLFRGLERLITVHSQQAGINSTVAPREVLLAMPGATPEQVEQYLAERRSLLEQGLPAPPFPPAQGFAAAPVGGVFSVQAEAVLGDNTRFLREAAVRLAGNGQRPVTILSWRAPFLASNAAAYTPGIDESNGQPR